MLCKLIGVPLQDGASQLGCEMGPSALRVAGLAETLESLGHDVRDLGNVDAGAAAEMSHPNSAIRNLGTIAAWTEVLAEVAYRESGEGMPIFLGGDHALSAGTVAGSNRAKAETCMACRWRISPGDRVSTATCLRSLRRSTAPMSA